MAGPSQGAASPAFRPGWRGKKGKGEAREGWQGRVEDKGVTECIRADIIIFTTLLWCFWTGQMPPSLTGVVGEQRAGRSRKRDEARGTNDKDQA